MTETEQKIHEALRALERDVALIKQGGGKPDLLGHFNRIDDLTRQLPASTDASLLHYLHKKSYEKARLHLEGRDAENARGSCHRD